MSKVLWHITMSLDGFVAGPGDDMSWLFGSGFDPDPQFVLRTSIRLAPCSSGTAPITAATATRAQRPRRASHTAEPGRGPSSYTPGTTR